MKKLLLITVLAVLAVPAFAQGQEPTETTGEARATREERAAAIERLRERIRRAVRLPGAADEARAAGIPEEEVEKVVIEARRRRMPVEETETVLVESAASARERGPVDNFGAFVQSQLDQGLRGRELAEAIHREHAAHGKGPMKGRKEGPPGQGKGKGKNEANHGGDHAKEHQVDEHVDGPEGDHDHGKKPPKDKNRGNRKRSNG